MDETRMRRPAPVLVVGVGDDGADGLTAKCLHRLHRADLIAGGRRHLDLFPDLPARRLVVTSDLNSVMATIEAAANDGRNVVVLASGDPCYFGIGPLLTERLGSERVEIVPGVSSVALAFARLGVGWQDARVVSAHGRPLSDAVQAALGAAKLAVLTDDANTPAVVADALLTAGAQDGPAWVFEHLGGSDEVATSSTLSGLTGRTFASLNVLVAPSLAWKQTPDAGGGLFGLPELSYAHSGGMITKPEVRAISLSKLRLRPGGVLWDVGAASGSLAIEAAGLIPRLTVCAVERSEDQVRHLWRNVGTRTTASRVRVIPGEAPEILAELPDPDAVFIGGSGGRLSEILTEAAARIKPNGRIVCNLVTIENLAEVLRWAESRGLPAEVAQVSIARSVDIVGMTRLQGENPVNVVTIAP